MKVIVAIVLTGALLGSTTGLLSWNQHANPAFDIQTSFILGGIFGGSIGFVVGVITAFILKENGYRV